MLFLLCACCIAPFGSVRFIYCVMQNIILGMTVQCNGLCTVAKKMLSLQNPSFNPQSFCLKKDLLVRTYNIPSPLSCVKPHSSSSLCFKGCVGFGSVRWLMAPRQMLVTSLGEGGRLGTYSRKWLCNLIQWDKLSKSKGSARHTSTQH